MNWWSDPLNISYRILQLRFSYSPHSKFELNMAFDHHRCNSKFITVSRNFLHDCWPIVYWQVSNTFENIRIRQDVLLYCKIFKFFITPKHIFLQKVIFTSLSELNAASKDIISWPSIGIIHSATRSQFTLITYSWFFRRRFIIYYSVLIDQWGSFIRGVNWSTISFECSSRIDWKQMKWTVPII